MCEAVCHVYNVVAIHIMCCQHTFNSAFLKISMHISYTSFFLHSFLIHLLATLSLIHFFIHFLSFTCSMYILTIGFSL